MASQRSVDEGGTGDIHKEVTMKALLDSRTTEIFMDKQFVEEQGFKLEKLDKPVEVKNIDSITLAGKILAK